jgi:hypothetical protein
MHKTTYKNSPYINVYTDIAAVNEKDPNQDDSNVPFQILPFFMYLNDYAQR